MMIPEFQPFPKIPRLSREMTITEKIDGTNGILHVTDDGELFIGSRNRWLTMETDNHGFHKWATLHKDELIRGLGPGTHYGEWWGNGIQRGYGLPNGDKRFSLFNVNRWGPNRDKVKYEDTLPECCGVVPVIRTYTFNTIVIAEILDALRENGSLAVPGFMNPEGIVIYHHASKQLFKKTIEGDEGGKG